MRVQALSARALLKLQGPLVELDHIVFHVADLEVRVVFPECVHGLLHENGLYEVITVAQLHHRDQLVEVKRERSLPNCGEGRLEVATCLDKQA